MSFFVFECPFALPIAKRLRKATQPSAHQPIDPSTHQPIQQSTHRPIDPSTRRPVDPSIPFARPGGMREAIKSAAHCFSSRDVAC